MIRRFFSQEWAKLKEMNFTDKRQYIWEYYKLHIFFISVSLIIVGSLINTWFINPPKREYLYISWQAGFVHADTLDTLGEKLNVIVPDQNRYRVSVRSYMLNDDDPQMNQAVITRFHALLSVGEIHATITTSQGIQEAADFSLIRSPAEILAIVNESNATLYEILTQRLLTITYMAFEEGAPDITETMAINISDAPMFVDMGFITDDLYLALISNSEQVEQVAQALAVMFGFEAERTEHIS